MLDVGVQRPAEEALQKGVGQRAVGHHLAVHQGIVQFQAAHFQVRESPRRPFHHQAREVQAFAHHASGARRITPDPRVRDGGTPRAVDFFVQ